MKLTKTTLNKMTKEELVDVSVKIQRITNVLRGYSSGLTKEMISCFDYDELVRCILESKQGLKRCYGLNVEEVIDFA